MDQVVQQQWQDNQTSTQEIYLVSLNLSECVFEGGGLIQFEWSQGIVLYVFVLKIQHL